MRFHLLAHLVRYDVGDQVTNGPRGDIAEVTFLTQSGHEPGQNIALRWTPDLMLVHPLCCHTGRGQRMQFGQLKRRNFIALFGGAAAWPLAARAQQTAKLPTIGFLGAGRASGYGKLADAFATRMHELGWVEGSTVAINYRWAEGNTERLADIAAEFVRLKVDVIVTNGNVAIAAAKRATSQIPIVFAGAGDPVGGGLVASLARPGGNVTGMSLQEIDTAGKRLEMLREVIPSLRRLAIVANSGNPSSAVEMREVQKAADTLGLEAISLDIRRPEEIRPALAGLGGRADALYVCGDPLMRDRRAEISTLAANAKLPTMFNQRSNVEAGGLMSYGPSFADLYRRAAEIVDKILRGAKPADIPVEQPTKFELVVNLTTARALGLIVPQTLLATADEVIE
jgi:putative tryptophan/tyrosine transport system substrate-binding protein